MKRETKTGIAAAAVATAAAVALVATEPAPEPALPPAVEAPRGEAVLAGLPEADLVRVARDGRIEWARVPYAEPSVAAAIREGMIDAGWKDFTPPTNAPGARSRLRAEPDGRRAVKLYWEEN